MKHPSLFLTHEFTQGVLRKFYHPTGPEEFHYIPRPNGQYYHDHLHILSIFKQAQAFNWKLTVEEELAILFHDSVYIPGASHNEEMSVHRMRQCVGETCQTRSNRFNCFLNTELGSQSGGIAKILSGAEQIIMDTINHFPTTEASNRVLDLDLFGLGGEEFRTNGDNIFHEFKSILLVKTDGDHKAAREIFKTGRADWAGHFLLRDNIYYTPECKGRDAAARANLQSLIPE